MSRAVPALIAATLLCGCAHLAREQRDGLSFAERQARLEAVPAWRMHGRLAVSTADRGFPGSFDWLQEGDRFTLSVRGPLGGGVLEVEGTPAELTVTARGERRVIENPETGLSELLGWWMPVESLPEWLLGLPDPAFPAELDFDESTTLRYLDQRLWHVAYDAYQLDHGVLVPRRIDMTHDDLRVRLTVDTWQPTQAEAHALN